MFDRIAYRYDLLNRTLSFGRDVVWRRKTASLLPKIDNQNILDIATGTGDVLLSIYKNNKNAAGFYGIDRSTEMLKIGREKKPDDPLKPFYLIPGDAVEIPFKPGTFHTVTIAFGIRNVPDVSQALNEMYRILKPGGRALILEFSLPENRPVRILYLFYFRYILPFVGSIISGDSYAYKYLNKTVETFPYGGAFNNLLVQSGFLNVKANKLSMGIATIYQGDKSK